MNLTHEQLRDLYDGLLKTSKHFIEDEDKDGMFILGLLTAQVFMYLNSEQHEDSHRRGTDIPNKDEVLRA